MSDEGVVRVEDWEKLQRRYTKLNAKFVRTSNALARLEAQVDRDNNEFAVAFLVEYRLRKQAEDELRALRVIADEHKRRARAAQRRNVKRKLDFDEK